MDDEDLSMYLTDFVCESGLWDNFLKFLEKKGFSEEELEDL
ncbi:MAG TPA: hypothetical protein VI911_11205 [Patescibacteria group bacterium]|nr:hypothetical protein [Patescibacteria group bacterium]